MYSVALAGSTIYALMTVASAYALGWVTQHTILPAFANHHTSAGSLLIAAALIIGVSIVKCVGVVMRRIGAGIMQYRLMGTYRRRITRQYLKLPLSWHQDWTTGTLLSNANSDVEAMWANIAPFPLACGVIIMLVTTAGLLVATDWVLAIVGFVVFPLVGVLTYVYGRAVAPRAMRAQELRGAVSSVAHDSFDGALVVKTLGREADETERFRARSVELRDGLVRLGRVRGLFDPTIEALPNLGVLAALLAGSYRLQHGAIDTGELVRVAYLFTLLALPIRAIGYVFAEMPRSVVGAERVYGVLEAQGSMPYGEASLGGSVDSAVGVSLRDVGYAYGAASPVLEQVTLDVPIGRTIAVVGPTGSGKSTLAGILVRLVDPTDGTVLYDDLDLRTLRQGEVSSAAALVPQQTFLFDDTVRGNIALGGDFTDDDVWAALCTAQGDRFVRALPRGLETLVGERGTTLSGGQRQRLALARAVIRRPRLLLLDDATSSVDPSVEQAILAGLARTTGSATATSVLVVAYRRATIALADEVVFVDEGRVVARGPHEVLLAEVEGYRALVTAYEQAEIELDDVLDIGADDDREPAA
ncbi:MAG: ATP-binding cassette, subfamily bacterial [Frankiales bacterium]|jgi:ABC-type multidrug transport system fused ATPase/permease subunit|nr:ATP-binding cassette, subfamily bacterial [Frankiales bacterium]